MVCQVPDAELAVGIIAGSADHPAGSPQPCQCHNGRGGIPDDQLKAAFCTGISKFNVGTEFFLLNRSLTCRFYTEEVEKAKPFADVEYIRAGLTDYVEQKLSLCRLVV